MTNILELVKEIPVVIFSLNERTKGLVKFSFESLGFKNIVVMEENTGFANKLRVFFEMTNDEKYKNHDLFIRTDADRICLPGIFDLCVKSVERLEKRKDNFLITEGNGYEYFMEKNRGATPHIFSRACMQHCLENDDELIKNILKPESHIGQYFSRKYDAFKHYDILTNFHEFEQFPSKMYYAFLTRINRGHLSYYDVDKILKDKYYGYPLRKAIETAQNTKETKNTMDYFDIEEDDKTLKQLDASIGTIHESKNKEMFDNAIRVYESMVEAS